MTPGHRDAYERALGDEEFRVAVRDHYRGSRDVLDALWWREHPGQASPQGEPAPSGRVRALQHRVFAADADAAGDDAVHRALRELEAEIAGERAAIDDAVLAAEQELAGADAISVVLASQVMPTRGGDTGPAEGDPGLPDENSDEIAGEGTDTPPAASGTHTGASRTWLRLAVGLVVAAVLGGVVGAQITGAVAGGAEAPATAATDPKAFEIFDRPQTVSDVPMPAIPLPASFQPLTLRSLGSISWDSADPPAESLFYVVRADPERVCLLLLLDDTHYLSSCVGESEFTVSGVTLYWSSDQGIADGALAPAAGQRDWFVEWEPNGGMNLGPVAFGDVS